MIIDFITADEIKDAFFELDQAMSDFALASNEHRRWEKTLKDKKASLESQGIEGKNAEIRAANLRLELAHEYDLMEQMEDAVAGAKLILDRKYNKKSEVLALLRLAEVLTQAEANEADS